jgi:tetratricopeptide (TPR) repeat protein
LDKAIEIKRRAQRCIQNGDMDGALAEYEKLVDIEDSDPYNYVLLADLHYKRGDQEKAVQRYLAAVAAYEKTTLYKNAIAVCKKMMRLTLAPSKVLERLASLHALDGLGTEAALFYMQYAEAQVRDNRPIEAAESLKKAFEASPDEIKALERQSEAWVLGEKPHEAAHAMAEAVYAYAKAGRLDHARRCRVRAEQLERGIMAKLQSERGEVPGLAGDAAAAADTTEAAPQVLNVPRATAAAEESEPVDEPETTKAEWEQPRRPVVPAVPAGTLEGLESGLETFPRPAPRNEAAPPKLAIPEPDDTPEDEYEDEEETEVEVQDVDESIEADADASNDTAIPMYLVDDEASPDAAPEEEEEPVDEEPEPAPPPRPAKSAAAARPATPAKTAAPARAAAPAKPAAPARPAAFVAASAAQPTMTQIEDLLGRAQHHFRAGERDAAGEALVEAALAYESIDRLENAASIFRSLGRGANATSKLLEHWLDNCVRRGDAKEAAEVACELGDRAVSDGDVDQARVWFERAVRHDPSNAVATRRLQRLAQINPPAPGAPPPRPAAPSAAERAAATPPAPSPAPEVESGRVEMAVGRAEAVTFDLGSLLAEFQRGIEAQLSGDAQSHYDLAMTYREMGLVEQALDAFRMAAADPAFAPRAAEMIGRCLLDQGRFEEATHEFMIALDAPDLAPDAAIGLRYHLGLALEAAGKLREAMLEFERVFALQANYSDVALRLRTMRKALEAA